MARSARRPRREQPETTAPPEDGSGSLIGQVGLFESANGFPHGPAAILVAVIAAVVIYPISRLIRMLVRR